VALTGLPLRIDPACIRLLAEVEWLDIAVTATGIAITAVLSAAALYFGNNLRRRTRAEVEANVAEKRLPAYAALWERTKIASPMRDTPLTPGERSQLFDDLTDWYYDGGHGMLLTETTRNIYLKAKANLTCAPEKLVPDSLRIVWRRTATWRVAGRPSINSRCCAHRCEPTSRFSQNHTTRS
jgi:hypothetical protein